MTTWLTVDNLLDLVDWHVIVVDLKLDFKIRAKDKTSTKILQKKQLKFIADFCASISHSNSTNIIFVASIK